jgi:NAD(P)-dependent dehydrogenase (short-subunit alcohol dehydrogenase family)
MDLQLAGKVALVTGGSVGIGKATALQLAQEGVDVAICARTRETLEAAAQEITQKTGRRIIAVPTDTTVAEQVHAMVQTTVDTLGRLDILVNNAGRPGGQATGPLSEVSDEDAMEDITFKFMTYLRSSRAAAEHMKRQGFGRIINVGGLAGRNVGTIAGARNLAITHLTKNLSVELGQYGITANVVHPGGTRTERTAGLVGAEAQKRGISEAEAEKQMYGDTAIRRIVDAEEVAYLIAFLASPLSVSVTGEVIAAGGGSGRALYI